MNLPLRMEPNPRIRTTLILTVLIEQIMKWKMTLSIIWMRKNSKRI